MTAFSLSTSWNASRHQNGFDLVNEIKAIGFDTIELNFTLREEVVRQILSMKNEGLIKVSSLHNICPLPAEIPPEKASPDYYSLASSDERERSMAVEAAKNTVLYANKLGARAVVLHGGRVEIKDRTGDLAASLGDPKRYEEMKAEIIRERSDNKVGHLDNLIRSLAELVPFANDAGVMLGMENRYYYREIPLMDELAEIFAAFSDKEIHYWHDMGHAQVFESLGLARHRDFLKRFGKRLIGVHLHDIIAPISDHKVPGSGIVDFRLVKPFLKKDTMLVLEVHQPATGSDIKKGVKYLKEVLHG